MANHGLVRAQETLDAAAAALADAQQLLDFTKAGADAEGLMAALQETAALYKSLHGKAVSAGLRVPREARLQSDADVVWTKDDLIGAQVRRRPLKPCFCPICSLGDDEHIDA